MTINRNAELSALLNNILMSVNIIEKEFETDISKHALDAFHDLHHNIVTIMDWNGSDLTKEHKIHDVGFYFIGENDGIYEESKIADRKGKEVYKLFNDYINEVKEIISESKEV